jgi:hypothetical protein
MVERMMRLRDPVCSSRRILWLTKVIMPVAKKMLFFFLSIVL